MDNMYKYLKKETNEAQHTESDRGILLLTSIIPWKPSQRKRRSTDEDEPHNRTRWLIGAVAALAAGT